MEKHKMVTYVILLILCMSLSGCATQKVRGKIEAETYPADESKDIITAPVLDSRVLTGRVVA